MNLTDCPDCCGCGGQEWADDPAFPPGYVDFEPCYGCLSTGKVANPEASYPARVRQVIDKYSADMLPEPIRAGVALLREYAQHEW